MKSNDAIEWPEINVSNPMEILEFFDKQADHFDTGKKK